MLKFFLGSLSLIALVLIAILLYGHYSFNKQVNTEVRAMLSVAEGEVPDIVSEEAVIQLPEPVQRWLYFSGVVGKPKIMTVRLKQEGRFRPAAEQAWLPFTAEEYFITSLPAFIWKARMKSGSFVRISAMDSLAGREGNMLVKLFSLFTVADAYGEEIDRGSLMRYLDEMIWFPSAALSEHVFWEPVDDNSAQATISYEGVSVSARFFFDAAGRVVNVDSERYRDDGGLFTVERWSTPILEYGEFDGIKVPVRGKAVWHLKDGDFEYFDARVTALEYDTTEPF